MPCYETSSFRSEDNYRGCFFFWHFKYVWRLRVGSFVWATEVLSYMVTVAQEANQLILQGDQWSPDNRAFLCGYIGAFLTKGPGTLSFTHPLSRYSKVPVACCCLCFLGSQKSQEDYANQADDGWYFSFTVSISPWLSARQGLHLVVQLFISLTPSWSILEGWSEEHGAKTNSDHAVEDVQTWQVE